MRFEQRQRLANTSDPKQHGKDPAPVLKFHSSVWVSALLLFDVSAVGEEG